MNLRTMDHYRTYMKIYGFMIVMLADSDEEVLKLINGENLGPLMIALRERIEDSPSYEGQLEDPPMNSENDNEVHENDDDIMDFDSDNLSDWLVRFYDNFSDMLDVLHFYHTAMEAIIEVSENNTDEQQHGMNLTWQWIDSTGQTLKGNLEMIRQQASTEEEIKQEESRENDNTAATV